MLPFSVLVEDSYLMTREAREAELRINPSTSGSVPLGRESVGRVSPWKARPGATSPTWRAKSLTLRISLFKLSPNPRAPTLASAGTDNLLILGDGSELS